MRKTFTYLSLLIAFMFAGTMSGWAQFEGRSTQYPMSTYDTKEIKFSLTEIANALETDTASLAKELNAWSDAYADEDETNDVAGFVSIIQPDGTKSEEYTQGGAGGFWMTTDGTVAVYGDTTTWYNQLSWDTAEDAFSIWVGQMPDTLEAGMATNATLAISYNGKDATIKFGIDVVALPEFNGMNDTIAISEIEIVKEYEVAHKMSQNDNYMSENLEIDITEGLALLGVNTDALAPNISKAIYTKYYKVTSEMEYAPDSLVNAYAYSSAAAPGWWYCRMYDEATATYSQELAAYGWGADDFFFNEVFAFDAETNLLTSRIGQYPGQSVGDTGYAYVYVVYGGKAIRIKYSLELEKAPTLPLEQMTQVGSVDFKVDHYIGGSVGTFTLDLATIEELLGTSTIEFQVLADEASLSSNTTATKGGYWMTKEGYSIGWGVEGFAMYVEPDTQGDFTSFVYGFNDGAWTLGDKSTVKLYFHNGTQYYLVNLNVEIIEQPQIGEDEFELVSTEGIYFQIIPSGAYTEDYMTTDLGIDYLTELLGEGTYKLYGMSAPNAEGVSTMTDAYSCTPYPGFWMTADTPEAYVGNHNGTNSFGMTYANGVITWYQYPNLRVAGDIYNATFYLLNESNNKMVKLAVVVEYVETIVETEEVGKEDVVLTVNGEDSECYFKYDLTQAATALGVEDPELLFASASIKVLKSAVSYTEDYYDGVYGWILNSEGYCIDAENNPEGAMTSAACLGYEWDGTAFDSFEFFTTTYMGEVPADGVVIKTKISIEYEAKVYILNVQIMNENTFTGIENVETSSKTAGDVYDLSGRVVRKNATDVKGLADGIYLLNGKKYIVK